MNEILKSIGIITTSRADYGILRPVIQAIDNHAGLEPKLFVTGSHFLESHGRTVKEIEADGWPIEARIDALTGKTDAASVSRSSGSTMIGFADAFERCRVDILLVLGDRFELFAAAAAAVPFNIPIAHIHGGELSYGAIDDAYRHALTKIAHLHFPATENYARRIAQMGEEVWRITVSGAPALDSILKADFMEREEIEQRFGISLDGRPSVVTYHPVTRETDRLAEHLQALRTVLLDANHPIIMTGSNVDTGGAECSAMLKQVAMERSDAYYVENFGARGYLGLLRHAGAMIGNSSSGIIEAASFALPVVNIGNRQNGRDRGNNVIDCEMQTGAIMAAVEKARSQSFRSTLDGLTNIYGSGDAGSIICNRLAEPVSTETLLLKKWNSEGWLQTR